MGRGLMKAASQTHYAQRRKVLEFARDLARSGRYGDHKSLLAHLESMDGFGGARDDLQTYRAQLDGLCALARPGRARMIIPGRHRAEDDGCTEQPRGDPLRLPREAHHGKSKLRGLL